MSIGYNSHAIFAAGCVLVTDAISAMGLGPGIHSLGKMSVEVTADARATLVGKDTLAGRSVYRIVKMGIGVVLVDRCASAPVGMRFYVYFRVGFSQRLAVCVCVCLWS